MTGRAWRLGVVLGVTTFALLLPLGRPGGRALAQSTSEEGGTTAQQDKDARQLFEAGRAAYDEGRFKKALVHFQAAHALSGRPALLYNVGQAADRLRSDKVALEAFERYVEELPEAPNRAAVEERIRVLREVLAEKEAPAEDEVVPVATPVEVARAAQPEPSAAPLTSEGAADDDSLLTKWWLWAAAGGVVVGAVVAVLVISSGGGDEQGEQTVGSDGRVIVALSY